MCAYMYVVMQTPLKSSDEPSESDMQCELELTLSDLSFYDHLYSPKR